MSHGHNRYSRVAVLLELSLFPFGDGADIRVVVFQAEDEFGILVLNGFSSLDGADVPVAEIGHGADYCLRVILFIAQHDDFIFRILCRGPDDMHIQGPQKFPGSIQKSGGVVVSGNDNDMTAAGG